MRVLIALCAAAIATSADAATFVYSFAANTDPSTNNFSLELDSTKGSLTGGSYNFDDVTVSAGGTQTIGHLLLYSNSASGGLALFPYSGPVTIVYFGPQLYDELYGPYRVVLKTGSFTLNGGRGTGVLTVAEASPVPEAATWAMMLVGFGAIGSAMRRRRIVVNFV